MIQLCFFLTQQKFWIIWPSGHVIRDLGDIRRSELEINTLKGKGKRLQAAWCSGPLDWSQAPRTWSHEENLLIIRMETKESSSNVQSHERSTPRSKHIGGWSHLPSLMGPNNPGGHHCWSKWSKRETGTGQNPTRRISSDGWHRTGASGGNTRVFWNGLLWTLIQASKLETAACWLATG